MKKIFIQSLGCSRRGLDAERIKNYFIANDCQITSSAKHADYLIVATCGLSKWFVETSIKRISDLDKFKGELIVYGCLPAMKPESLKKVFDGKMVITKNLETLDGLFPDFPVRFKDIEDANRSFGMPPKAIELLQADVIRMIKDQFPITEGVIGGIGFNNRFPTLRISEGCLGNCSYCGIKKAIGKLKSKPVDALLYELRKILSQKKYGINIASSDSGSYGKDIGTNFPQLLKTILDEDERITIEYIQDLNPSWICFYEDNFMGLLKTKRIKSILFPIQSGNARILKSMNRSLDINKFKRIVKGMRKASPRLRLRTQVIAGFPSETKEEFQDTIDFFKECKIDQVDIFAYYEVEGTDAADLVPKIPEGVVRERVKILKRALNH
jgi:tRNA A37 methylthiotransferase MiaB